jgi:hypothetical protein
MSMIDVPKSKHQQHQQQHHHRLFLRRPSPELGDNNNPQDDMDYRLLNLTMQSHY